MTFSVVAARYSHVNRIANRMRACDVLEARAFGHTPKRALVLGLRASTLCWTIMADDRPIGLVGCVPDSLIDRTGIVWALGTDEAFAARRLWFTAGPALLAAMRGEYPHLSNVCAVENVQAVRVLRRLGFTFDDDVCYVQGVAFRRFSIGPD